MATGKSKFNSKFALVKYFLGVILLWTLVFLPAWSLHYWQGWLLMGILFVPIFVAGLVLASPISFFIMLGYIPVIARRIKNEEKVLEDGLEGYAEYKESGFRFSCPALHAPIT